MISSGQQRERQAWGWTAAVFALSLILVGGYGYFVSRGRIFWSDELFGWMLITDPSWVHMIASWRDGLDGAV